MNNFQQNNDHEFRGYNGNPNLKKPGHAINWTHEQTQEWIKCAMDPIYFAEKYIKIVHVDHGFIDIVLYDYQKEMKPAKGLVYFSLLHNSAF